MTPTKRNRRQQPLYKPKGQTTSVNQDVIDKFLAAPTAHSVVDAALQSDILKQWDERLLAQYNEALVTDRGYPDLTCLHKSHDIIDIRALFAQDGQPDDEDDPVSYFRLHMSDAERSRCLSHLTQRGWTSWLPCLPDGILHVYDTMSVYFRLNSIDMENRQADLSLVFYHRGPLRYFDSNVHAIASFARGDDQPPDILNLSSLPTTEQVYRSANMARHGWNAYDRQRWESVMDEIVTANKRIYRNLSPGRTLQQELAMDFITWMGYANAVIAMSETHTVERAQPSAKTMQRSFATSQPMPPSVHSYKLGGKTIRVRSAQSPSPTRRHDNKMTCATPAWRVRGHTRHYKNGKTVYIQPHVSHRHGMDQNPEKIRQTILRIKKGEMTT